MTLEECREHIGRKVLYHGHQEDEEGVISSTGRWYAMVRYGGSAFPKATRPDALTLADSPATLLSGVHPEAASAPEDAPDRHYGTDDGAGSLHRGTRAGCTHPDCCGQCR